MIDNTDEKIIQLLQDNSRMKVKEISDKVCLSAPAVSQRIMKLEEEGIIKKYTTEINYEKIGYPIHVLLNVSLLDISHSNYLNFIKESRHVIKHYRVSGRGCYSLEGNFESNKNLDSFLVKLNEFCTYSLSIVIGEL